MDFQETLIAGMLISLVVWLITNVFRFFIKSHRLKNTLVADIKYHLSGVMEAKTFLEKLFDENIKENKLLDNRVF